MKIPADSIEEFFANCDQREADMRKLDSLIQKVTVLKPVLFTTSLNRHQNPLPHQSGH